MLQQISYTLNIILNEISLKCLPETLNLRSDQACKESAGFSQAVLYKAIPSVLYNVTGHFP